MSERFILTRVGPYRLAIPFQWVAEIMILERRSLLSLPFYANSLLGVVYHQGQVVPLVAMMETLGLREELRSLLTVVRLTAAIGSLANVGLVVDSLVGTYTQDQLPATLLQPGSQAVADSDGSSFLLFQPDMLNASLWQPIGWRS